MLRGESSRTGVCTHRPLAPPSLHVVDSKPPTSNHHPSQPLNPAPQPILSLPHPPPRPFFLPPLPSSPTTPQPFNPSSPFPIPQSLPSFPLPSSPSPIPAKTPSAAISSTLGVYDLVHTEVQLRSIRAWSGVEGRGGVCGGVRGGEGSGG